MSVTEDELLELEERHYRFVRHSLRLLKRLEWSAKVDLFGVWPLDYQREYPGCPVCGQFKRANRESKTSEVGHKKRCLLMRTIKTLEEDDLIRQSNKRK